MSDRNNGPERAWLDIYGRGWREDHHLSAVPYVRADLYEALERKLEDEKLRECRTCATAGATVLRLKRRLAEAEERAAEARRKALLAATDLTNSRKRLMYTEEERLELAQRAWETLMALRRELEVDRG